MKLTIVTAILALYLLAACGGDGGPDNNVCGWVSHDGQAQTWECQ